MAVCTGEVTPGSAVTAISTDQAMACMALKLNKDSWSCSHLASRQRSEHLFFRDDGGPVLVMLLRGDVLLPLGISSRTLGWREESWGLHWRGWWGDQGERGDIRAVFAKTP